MATKTFVTRSRAAGQPLTRHQATLEGIYQEQPPKPDDAGDDWTPPTEWAESFEFVAVAPFGAVSRVMAGFGVNESGQVEIHGVNLTRFFQEVVVPSDTARLMVLFEDKYRAWDIRDGAELVMWLVGLYADRPSMPSAT